MRIIKGAFDNISHNFLLQAIDGFPTKELIKQWLKAGYGRTKIDMSLVPVTPVRSYRKTWWVTIPVLRKLKKEPGY